MLTDLHVYYGPLHKIHHKYLGMTSHKGLKDDLKLLADVKDYPLGERLFTLDFNIDVEGRYLETPEENVTVRNPVHKQNKVLPFYDWVYKITDHKPFGPYLFGIIHSLTQILRKIKREGWCFVYFVVFCYKTLK